MTPKSGDTIPARQIARLSTVQSPISLSRIMGRRWCERVAASLERVPETAEVLAGLVRAIQWPAQPNCGLRRLCGVGLKADIEQETLHMMLSADCVIMVAVAFFAEAIDMPR